MTPRLLMLHLRSRRTGWALALLAGIAVTNRATSPWADSTNPTGWLLLALPAVAASAVIAGSMHSPFGEPEQATNPLHQLKMSHLAVLLPLAAGLLALAQEDPLSAVRNLAGLTGLALLAGWIAPLAYTILCAGAIDLHDTSLWTWPALPATDPNAMLISLALLATGTITAIQRRARPA